MSITYNPNNDNIYDVTNEKTDNKTDHKTDYDTDPGRVTKKNLIGIVGKTIGGIQYVIPDIVL